MIIDLKELFEKYSIEPKGILHVGANTGQEAQLYSELGVWNVMWIEANPEIYQQLVENVSKYGHKTENYAAGNREGTIILHVASNDGLSSSVLGLGTHKIDHPTVHYVKDIEVKISRIIPKPEYDFLVLDTQGSELEVLLGMGDYVNQFKWIYSEINRNEVYEDCALVSDLDEYLHDCFGFRRVETQWNNTTGWGEGFYIKETI